RRYCEQHAQRKGPEKRVRVHRVECSNVEPLSILVSQLYQKFGTTAAKTWLVWPCEEPAGRANARPLTPTLARQDRRSTIDRRCAARACLIQASPLRRHGNRLAGKSAAGLRGRAGGITGRAVGSGTITWR